MWVLKDSPAPHPRIVQRFLHCAHCVPFLVGVLHYRKYTERLLLWGGMGIGMLKPFCH